MHSPTVLNCQIHASHFTSGCTIFSYWLILQIFLFIVNQQHRPTLISAIYQLPGMT